MKEEPSLGVIFKLFSVSSNTKILPSELVTFTLVKESERSLVGGRLSLFRINWPYLRKRTFWSLLGHLRLSKHETTNDFAFIGLIKQNDGRPYLGTNPSFLRFIKYVRMGSLYYELERVFVTLFGLVKTKRGTHQS